MTWSRPWRPGRCRSGRPGRSPAGGGGRAPPPGSWCPSPPRWGKRLPRDRRAPGPRSPPRPCRRPSSRRPSPDSDPRDRALRRRPPRRSRAGGPGFGRRSGRSCGCSGTCPAAGCSGPSSRRRQTGRSRRTGRHAGRAKRCPRRPAPRGTGLPASSSWRWALLQPSARAPRSAAVRIPHRILSMVSPEPGWPARRGTGGGDRRSRILAPNSPSRPAIGPRFRAVRDGQTERDDAVGALQLAHHDRGEDPRIDVAAAQDQPDFAAAEPIRLASSAASPPRPRLPPWSSAR